MAKTGKNRLKKVGSSPGTLVFVGERKMDRPHISVMDYDSRHLEERVIDNIQAASTLSDLPSVTWINMEGIHDLDLLSGIGSQFGIHPLTLEDIANTAHRPKAEEFDTYLFIVFKMLRFNEMQTQIISEQVSLVLGRHFLISFQESPGDVFEPVRDRLRKGKGRIQKSGCDYLAYALIDAVVDHYYLILEKLDDRIEFIEEALLSKGPEKSLLETMHQLRREALYLRKQIWPLREMVNLLRKGEFERIEATTQVFLSDVHDHVIQVLDTIEVYRETLNGLLELYHSALSNRMNEVMKVLTIIATIFIPITFVAGIYGMNFDFMPELHWRLGYLGVWGVICAIAVAMILYFKRKDWL